jgi:hypothetical protein
VKGVPHIRQKPDFCGEACVAMVLQKHGRDVSQDMVFELSNLSPELGRGCHTRELVTATKNLGFKIGRVGEWIEADSADQLLRKAWQVVLGDLRRDIPSILCTRFDESPETTEHFRLIIGFDEDKQEVIYHDPALDKGANLRMPLATMLSLWPLKYKENRWLLIRFRMAYNRIKLPRPTAGHSAADYAQHVMALKKTLPEGFSLVLQPPFVVVGDEEAAVVKRRSRGTVGSSVARLKRQYFLKDPDNIITVWLFKDKASYEKHCEELFGEVPDTPYGYYSPDDNALIMNISTGGGTLVHELVHPFIASNFKACPSWFNEGLASLYEQSAHAGNSIVGLPNWRLKGLQKAIAGNRLPSFEAMMTTTSTEFYGSPDGYAQARYLCLYLQERKLLNKYYHTFVANADVDPTGYLILQKILNRRDMEVFQKEWEAWVMKLRFP